MDPLRIALLDSVLLTFLVEVDEQLIHVPISQSMRVVVGRKTPSLTWRHGV